VDQTESHKSTTSSETNTPLIIPEEDAKPNIIWVTEVGRIIKPDTQEKIQQYINDIGIECKIRFISSYDSGQVYKSWVEELVLNGNGPDILSSAYWDHGHFDAMEYIKESFLPLNDYLDSENGRSLREAFSEGEWERSMVDGTIYTLPARDKSITKSKLHVYVNDRYKESFDRFYDGSYGSMKKILDFHSNTKLHISLEGFGMPLISSFLGCQTVYFAYCQQSTGELVDLTRQLETKILFQTLYEDCKAGIIRYNISENDLSEDDLVWLSLEGSAQPIEGYSDYLLSPFRPLTKVAGVYGILASSPRKELALKVLFACYSDPKIASLLYWGKEDEEGWIAYTKYMNAQPTDILTGFIPKLTKEQIDALVKYYNDLYELTSRMMVTKGGGRIELNSDFPNYLDRFFEEPHDYGDAISVMNEQLQDWIKEKQKH
ncbi:MAG: hypothetical protein J6T47_07475, partial [Lachnospiraceae bacterium]|nr:hypothetical protein [Lachnospiraceae bacterium]